MPCPVRCDFGPGLIIIPTDLDYFIQFELKDRQHRKIAAEAGVALQR